MLQESQEESPYHQQMIFSDQQINNKIISANVNQNFFYIVQPNFVEKKVAVILKDKKGNPVKTDEGEMVFEEKKLEVFNGFIERKMRFPIENIFNDTLSSSFLTEHDVQVTRSAYGIIATLLVKMVNEKKDYTETITKLNMDNQSIGTTAKGRNGVAALTAKTNINKGESIERLVQEQKMVQQLEKEKAKGIFGGMFG